MDKNHILIVEDDADIRSGIEIYLKNQGYDVSQAGDGIEGLAIIEKEEIDLAIVDIMMPRMDGITMMMKVREKGYDFPVIMLSAKSEEVDKIMGLNMGADDYITKPFTPLELLARVNSHLRRYNRYREAIASAEPVKDTYHVLGGIELNEETVEVFVDGAPVRLTPIEFKILLLLMRNPGRVFSADEIYERIWNEKAVNTDTIMVHVRKIREKIEIDPKNPKYLKVVWGVWILFRPCRRCDSCDISVYWRRKNGKCETFHSGDLYDLGGGFPALYRGRYCLPARAFAYFEYAGKSVSACVCLSAGLLYRTWRTAFIQRGIKPFEGDWKQQSTAYFSDHFLCVEYYIGFCVYSGVSYGCDRSSCSDDSGPKPFRGRLSDLQLSEISAAACQKRRF